MAKTKQPELSSQLAALQQSFSAQLGQRLDDIKRLWDSVLSNPDSSGQLDDLHLKLHNLVGGAGTFGAMSISKAAKAVETCLNSIQEQDTTLETETDRIQGLLDNLYRIAQAWQPSGLPYISPPLKSQRTRQHNNLIFLVDDDVEVARELRTILEKAGYKVEAFTKLNDFRRICLTSRAPGIIIMDLIFEEGNVAGAEIIQELRREWEELPPIIFISVRNDAEARLATVRAGAHRFFNKPIDYKILCQTIDGLSGRLLKSPYRVLIIDDQEAVLEFHATLLKEVGIQVEGLTDPMQTLARMEEFHPDLVLLDVYMPVCSGLELASMIRQDDKWAQMPIVFLSNELVLEKQLTALDLGGDDFLTKPVDGEHLISAILARLKRARWISRLNRDLNEALKKSEYLGIALDQHSIVSITDSQGVITQINDKFCEISGYGRDELIGQTHRIINSGTHPRQFFQQMWTAIHQGSVWHGVICNRAKDGTPFWNEMTIVPFLDDDNNPYQYVAIRTDITAIKSAQQELVHAKEVAVNANSAKNLFLSKMSHELRTPLNVILGFSHLMKKDRKFPLLGPQLEGINEISQAGNHLLDLINEVLDLAQIESGRIDLNFRAVYLQDLIENCRSSFSPMLRDYQLHWGECRPCSGIAVNADMTRLKQVLLNLLSNACKYNRPDGQVAINCYPSDNDMIKIVVSDTGEGIAEKDYHKLFEPFGRITPDSHNVEGAGIGLLVTKQLVELMGGNIGFESQPHEGTNFWIELPRDQMTPGDANSHPDDNNGTDEILKHHGTILYIEDNPANLRLITRLLTSQTNLRVLAAQRPDLGLEMAHDQVPDLILLDINLPGMDGFQVLQKLRTDARTQEIPVIAISANAMPHDIEKGMDAGFVEYLTKPVDVDKLMSAIDFVFKI